MPDWKPEIRTRLAGLNLEPAREAGIIEEISQHLDDRFAELRAGGVSEVEARRMALEELSSEDALAKELRQVERLERPEPLALDPLKGNMLEELMADLKYGARILRKNPGFAAVAVLTLALGIGANTAIFSFVNAILLRPLPYKDPSRLVMVFEAFVANGSSKDAVGAPMLGEWRKQATVFEGLAARSWEALFSPALTSRKIFPARACRRTSFRCSASSHYSDAPSRPKRRLSAKTTLSCSAMNCGNGALAAIRKSWARASPSMRNLTSLSASCRRERSFPSETPSFGPRWPSVLMICNRVTRIDTWCMAA